MKVGSWGLAAVTFVLGLALGGVGPRAELRALQEAPPTVARGDRASDITGLLTGGVLGGANRGVTPPPSTVEPTEIPEGPEAEGQPPRMKAEGEPPVDGEISGVEEMREALALRAAQARAALQQEVSPTPEQLDAIDAVIDQMNDRLVELSYQLVDATEGGGEPDRREMMGLASDVLHTLVEAERGMLGALTPEQVEAVRQEATDPTAFVDAAVLDVLSEISGEKEP